MKISYNWLQQFVKPTCSPEELSAALTDCGLEVEQMSKWQSVEGGLQGLCVGKVLTCVQHPNADRLHITTVDIGDGVAKQIVCGAPNVAAGQTVVVALPGTVLYPAGGELFEIKKSKIRGEASEGMICAEDEIGLGTSHAGILILPDTIAVGTPVADYFKVEDDIVFEIGLTPNRADAASHLGVARDVKALFGTDTKVQLNMPSVDGFTEGNKENSITVEIKNAEGCSRYSGIEISGIRVAPSPDWLQNRLKSIGVRPINNVVDITNYIMHDLGQPLHAFDKSKIQGNKILVGNLPAGTKFKTLDAVERDLVGTELMIADAEGGLCIAGVFGGWDSGVNENTTSIFLESACFHPVHVRKSARQQGLHTDSSFRFERGTDPELTVYALKRAALLIAELAGGNVDGKIIDLYPVKIPSAKMEISYQYLSSIIGAEIEKATIHRILKDLQIEIVSENAEGMQLSVPSFKVDVTRPADIAEEVLRIYGYNNIALPKKISISAGQHISPDPEEIVERLGSVLVGNGFREILTNSLTKNAYLDIVPTQEGIEGVQVLNPLSNDLALLRHSMLMTGLETIAYNVNRRQKDLRFFELGKTYGKVKGKYLENQWLCLFITGEMVSEHWKVKSQTYDIYFVKSIVDKMLSDIGIHLQKQIKLEPVTSDSLDQCLSYSVKSSSLVKMGKVKKSVLKACDVSQDVWYAEFHFENLMRAIETKDRIVPGPPKFPEVRRDLSMVLDKAVQYAELESIAFATEPKLLKQVNLFDVYEGDKIEAGKKSYAMSFILRDDEATLQDKQIDSVMNKLMKQLETKLNVVIRKS